MKGTAEMLVFREILKFVSPRCVEVTNITKALFRTIMEKWDKQFLAVFVYLSVTINFLLLNYSGKHSLVTQRETRKDK